MKRYLTTCNKKGINYIKPELEALKQEKDDAVE